MVELRIYVCFERARYKSTDHGSGSCCIQDKCLPAALQTHGICINKSNPRIIQHDPYALESHAKALHPRVTANKIGQQQPLQVAQSRTHGKYPSVLLFTTTQESELVVYSSASSTTLTRLSRASEK